jgi:hypothetical protein
MDISFANLKDDPNWRRKYVLFVRTKHYTQIHLNYKREMG